MYREWRSERAGAIMWTRTVRPGHTAHRILPDGCLDLIWVEGKLLVAGPDTVARVAVSPVGACYVGLRFPPGAGPAVLGVPAHELRDRLLPLDSLWPGARVRRLTEQVAHAPDPIRAVESIAADRRGPDQQGGVRPRDTGSADPAMLAVAALLRAGQPVAATAAAIGLSERQLHRRCLPAFGYGPKTLARILRLDRAVTLARAGTPFATVAASTGYADQAHLSREVKALAGIPLGALVS
jgi:AraC-like DNA-binding protein